MTSTQPDCSPLGKYTPTQAARLLGVSRLTIYRAMASSVLPFTLAKDMKRRYIKGSSIIRYYNVH